MSDSDNSLNPNAGLSSTVTGEITIAVVIIIFMLFAVALILYLRAKGYSGTMGAASRRLEFAPNQPGVQKQALDAAILNSLPVTVFQREDFAEEGGLECAVCLSELSDGEKARLLPGCRHGFHVQCIDMWFLSNSTCPVCRNPVGDTHNIKQVVGTPIQHPETASESGHRPELEVPPKSSGEGTSSSGGSFSEKRRRGMLVIEIPRRAISPLNTPLPSSRMVAEGVKSPTLERLRRMLSRGGLNGNSPRNGDIEQGSSVGSTLQKSLSVPESNSCL